MKLKYLFALVLSALLYSCDDSTYGIGDSTMQEKPNISPAQNPFWPIPSMLELTQLIWANILIPHSANLQQISLHSSIVPIISNSLKISKKSRSWNSVCTTTSSLEIH